MTSYLTFNFSVSNKKKLAGYQEPFQIMPATINYIKNSDINSYENINNPLILIHMNYITRMFSANGLEKDSMIRYSLSQYGKLADKIGTKNILIHLPKTYQEWENFILGYKIIHDELISKGYKIHFEITAWSKDLHSHFGKNEDRMTAIDKYFGKLLEISESYGDSVFIVIDTAHMFSNGCDEECIIKAIEKYNKWIEYIHLNGNCRPMWTSDSHVPIFSSESNMSYDKLSKYVATLGKVCICEITKERNSNEKWKEYAAKYGFKLVDDNEMATK